MNFGFGERDIQNLIRSRAYMPVAHLSIHELTRLLQAWYFRVLLYIWLGTLVAAQDPLTTSEAIVSQSTSALDPTQARLVPRELSNEARTRCRGRRIVLVAHKAQQIVL